MSPEGAASRSARSETAQGGLGAVSIGKSYRGRRVVKDVSLFLILRQFVGAARPAATPAPTPGPGPGQASG